MGDVRTSEWCSVDKKTTTAFSNHQYSPNDKLNQLKSFNFCDQIYSDVCKQPVILQYYVTVNYR